MRLKTWQWAALGVAVYWYFFMRKPKSETLSQRYAGVNNYVELR